MQTQLNLTPLGSLFHYQGILTPKRKWNLKRRFPLMFVIYSLIFFAYHFLRLLRLSLGVNKLFDLKICTYISGQWRIQDFPEGRTPTPKSAIIFQFIAENCMKRIWTTGEGGVPGASPLGSAGEWAWLWTFKSFYDSKATNVWSLVNTRTYLLIDLFRDRPVISGSGKYVNTASFLDGVTPETFTLVNVLFKSPFRGLVTHVMFTAVMLVAGSLYSFALCKWKTSKSCQKGWSGLVQTVLAKSNLKLNIAFDVHCLSNICAWWRI